MAKDPELLAHQQWLGYLQPVGLVVSPPALLQAQAYVRREVLAEHRHFLEYVEEGQSVRDLRALLLDVFGWQASDFVEACDPRTANLEVVLPEYHETLRPTYAVPDAPLADGRSEWLMLLQMLPNATPLDEIIAADGRWQTTPQARFERLLRETRVSIGLLDNGTHLRLVYAPRGESTGHLTFPVQAMSETAGRPVFAALLMLLSAERLFSLPDKQRLPAILADSRKYQNTVSNELAQQVLAALYELLRGFQAADAQRNGDLLRDVLSRDPDLVYAGLLTVLLRLVFLLYAEDRGLMSDDEVYLKHYSVAGLFERLRADAGHHPDTMDLRYGAWAQLLALFRLVHNGVRHGKLRLPPRHGYLFDPQRYPFLEGGAAIPLVADGVLFRVLQNLLVLDGERISYRSLDVEQIGSVYETMMGFRLEKATGRSLAIKPTKAHGAPVTIDLDALLRLPAKDRGKWLKERTDQNVTGAALNALKSADTPEALAAALERKIARELTPNIVPPSSIVLQPSDERRRSGSHYTPRSLTEPIVRKGLEPVLKQLGEQPTAPQLLALKMCDPAMGSGAFLVEACRQLGELLVKAWNVHGGMPKVPDDETPELLAQRLIAQRCLYGVDKNPMAVDLAKMSLWLATLAKDHAFTFLDHALRCGDSLVGLTCEQIVRFHWKHGPQQQTLDAPYLLQCLQAATRCRQEILDAGDEVAFDLKQQKLALADESLGLVRFAGNLVVAAFFAADNERKRQAKRDELVAQLVKYLLTGNMSLRPSAAEKTLTTGDKGIAPFHWEIEFPEVFSRENPGFDCIVGNPPFMGGSIVSSSLGMTYFAWLTTTYPPAGHLCDLVAYFFRRVFALLRDGATLGLVATNTIAQGDTREGGLREIVKQGGVIYDATKRFRWPGLAAVIVSLLNITKRRSLSALLDGKAVERISSFLFERGGDESPSILTGRGELWSLGTKIYGAGFLFEDGSEESTPLELMREILKQHPSYEAVIRPYIGGEEINTHPYQEHSRFVINLNDVAEESALDAWPELRDILHEKVKPARDALGPNPNNAPLKKRWWAFQGHRPEFYRAARRFPRVLAQSQVSAHLGFVFQPTDRIFANTLNLFLFDFYAAFCTLQSRVHEIWARFFGSSMKDDLRYTPSDCFETFPFPEGVLEPLPDGRGSAESVGKEYYEFRAALMVQNNEGLTKTYNRFHDPNERSADIARLRQLHAAMDRAVLDAYGWTDLQPTCEFLLDYEEEEDEDSPLTPNPSPQRGEGRRARKKPWRYRWPDVFRDEVLARLLELNKQRAEQEALAGAAVEKKQTAKRGKRKKGDAQKGDLFRE